MADSSIRIKQVTYFTAPKISQTLLLYAPTCGNVLGRSGAHFRIWTILLQASTACCSLILPWTRLWMYKCSTKDVAKDFIAVNVILDVAACLSTVFQRTCISNDNCKSLLNGKNYESIFNLFEPHPRLGQQFCLAILGERDKDGCTIKKHEMV